MKIKNHCPKKQKVYKYHLLHLTICIKDLTYFLVTIQHTLFLLIKDVKFDTPSFLDPSSKILLLFILGKLKILNDFGIKHIIQKIRDREHIPKEKNF